MNQEQLDWDPPLPFQTQSASSGTRFISLKRKQMEGKPWRSEKLSPFRVAIYLPGEKPPPPWALLGCPSHCKDGSSLHRPPPHLGT